MMWKDDLPMGWRCYHQVGTTVFSMPTLGAEEEMAGVLAENTGNVADYESGSKLK